MRVEGGIAPPERITIVDDVVTKGRSLVAAAELLRAAFPDSEIQAFAISRTLGFVDDVPKVTVPVVGVIRRNGDDAVRNP
jgi:orotate phosphoribosyltransferase